MAAILTLPQAAGAVKIGDITHLQGSRSNKLTGMGLVMGLKGSGDGGKFAPALRSLARLYRNYGIDAATLDELRNAKNVAIVEVEATLPQEGVREGDRVDVRVVSAGGAKSLAGGQLFMTPLVSGNPMDTRVMAVASGPLQLPDPEMPTVARIAQGATVERDFIHNYVALGRELAVYAVRSASRPLEWLQADERYVTFVIEEAHAEWSIAHTIAQCINEEALVSDMDTGEGDQGQLAVAFDPRTVIVRLPRADWDNPAPFVFRLEKMQLIMPLTEARVVIDRTSGTIVVKGDVEISPVALTHKSLTIVTTMTGGPEPAPGTPRTSTGSFLAVDPQHRGGAKLMDLLEALNQLKVPAEDRIGIIENLHKGGQLHANLIVQH
ncbi:MAG: flagellar basal body P-ring protein FlgI [Planctomycetes bacterium]|nr:flagellar basal body P-ring protein FlgI [Planctomycetota bacterium]